tara:strand:+ start:210 stop:872 length:663 start_codon:yes stop_codon:yes gene_type:complete
VKSILLFIFSLVIIYPKSNYFNIVSGNSREIIHASSLWLSGTPMTNPMAKNRFFLEIGSSLSLLANNRYKYPNVDIGMKVTKNLSILNKVFGFKADNEYPQIIGAGLQYYFGSRDSLDWSATVQRINLKGLKYFSLSSLSIDLRKWYHLNSYKFRLGIGSNYFKERTYTNTDVLPAVIKGQINYLGFDFSLPLGTFNIGLENQISKSMIISTAFVQKEIF